MASRLSFQPATAGDADFWADLMTEAHPDEPWDPDVLRHQWAFEDRDAIANRWLLVAEGRRVGIAETLHPRWERTSERFVYVNAWTWADGHAALLGEAYDELEGIARADEAEKLEAMTREDDAPRIEFLLGRGFARDRLEKVWELDLVANSDRIHAFAEQTRRQMHDQGVELLTLDRWDAPDTYRQLYELDMAATADIPSTDTFVPHEFEDWRLWFTKPGLYPDRFWLARHDGRLLGLSLLLFPRRAPVMTDFTAVARSARGRGIARALKCETLVQALELGVPTVRTSNDSENAPILHLNEDFGYEARPAWIVFLKNVR